MEDPHRPAEHQHGDHARADPPSSALHHRRCPHGTL